jgi:hypothetical protein
MAGMHLFMHSLDQYQQLNTSADDEHMSSHVSRRIAGPKEDLRDL